MGERSHFLCGSWGQTQVVRRASSVSIHRAILPAHCIWEEAGACLTDTWSVDLAISPGISCVPFCPVPFCAVCLSFRVCPSALLLHSSPTAPFTQDGLCPVALAFVIPPSPCQRPSRPASPFSVPSLIWCGLEGVCVLPSPPSLLTVVMRHSHQTTGTFS